MRLDTKCWDCKNSSRCEWSNGEVVPGWNAIPTKINLGKKEVDSYIVIDCPKFEKLNYQTKKERLMNLAKIYGISYDRMRRKLKIK